MTASRSMARARLVVVAAALALGLVACGTGTGAAGGGSAGTAPASSSSAAPPVSASGAGPASRSVSGNGGVATGTGTQVGTASGPLGTYLVDKSGRALYLWVKDSAGPSQCSGSCAAVWPPLTTTGTPTATGKAIQADLGTFRRADGTVQVTYHGWPLYYFAQDTRAGETSGQGNDGFGAKWWLMAPSGSEITGAASAPSSTAAAGGYGNGY